MTGGYLRVAGVLSGIGGRVIVHGGSQDIFIAASSQWPVMRVTSWRGSFVKVDSSGKGEVRVLASSVDDSGSSPSPDVVESSGNSVTEELGSCPFPSSILDVDPGSGASPVSVLTTVVTTLVLN